MRFEEKGLPRFITFSCDGRRNLFTDPDLMDIFVDQLSVTKDRFSLNIYAWVLMPNHVHLVLLCDTEIATVTSVLTALKTRTAERVLPLLRQRFPQSMLPRLWLRGSGYDRVIRNAEDLAEKAAYIEMNPVRKGLAAEPGAYRWSSCGSDVLPRDPWWE